MICSRSKVGFQLDPLHGRKIDKYKRLGNGPRPSQKMQLDWGTSGKWFSGRQSPNLEGNTPPPSSIRNLKDWRVTRIYYFFQTQILGNPRARVSRNISYCRHSPKTVPIPSQYRPSTVPIPSRFRLNTVRFRPNTVPIPIHIHREYPKPRKIKEKRVEPRG